jgi:hypothetical protein
MNRIAFFATLAPLFAQVDVLMSQYDTDRTAANRQERILHPSNVNPTQFGKLFSRTVDNSQYALPLIVSNVDLPGGVRKNLLIVATMGNTLYAFDAETPSATAPVWSRNLGTPMVSGGFIGPTTWGILATPYIDRATGTIYTIAKVGTQSGVVHQLNALDIATGALKYSSPQNVTFPVGGTSTVITFSVDAIQRVGLLVDRGVLYAAFANVVITPGVATTQEGYLQSFSATDLSVRHASFQVTPTGLKGGIWQAGRGLTVDAAGNVYLVTAGGQYNGVDNFGTSILKFASRTLTLLDWFTPSNWDALYHGNIDTSANGVTLIPNTSLAFSGGKEGVVYLLNRNNLGRLEGNGNAPPQRFQASSGCGLIDCAQNLGTAFWSRPTLTESMLYVWDRRDFLRAYRFSNASQRFDTQAAAVGPLKPEQAGGPSVSAWGDDAASGIVWAVTVPTDANSDLTEAVLRAYRASDVSQELYNSDINRTRDRLGFYSKFAAPVVANGKVYVSTHSNEVAVYGLLQPRVLSVSVTGGGLVTSNIGGLSCPQVCTATLADQASVQLNALPAPGTLFTGWSGACSGTSSVCTVAMNGDKTVAATFVNTAALTVTKTGSGSVSVDGTGCGDPCVTQFILGSSVTLTARAAPGAQFLTWAGGVCAGSTSTTCTFVFAGPTAVAANFSAITPPTLGYHFLPVAPCRAADTRPSSIPAKTARNFTFANCGIPANAVAVAANVTLVPKGQLGYLTIWPAGQSQPVVSTMNALDGRVKANAVIVGVGTNQAVSVYVTDAADVVLDVNGFFVPPATADSLAFYPAAPCRLLDTRLPASGGLMAALETRRIDVGVKCLPSGARAYSMNVTVVPQGPLGFLTLWPDGIARPTVSTLNAPTGTVVANAALAQGSGSTPGLNGAMNVYVTEPSHVIIDVNGYFAPPSSNGLAFYPVAPCRIVDTRLNGGPMARLETRDFNVPAVTACGVPAAARAYSLNATVVPSAAFGYLTLWAAGETMPVVSTLNAVDAAITSNLAIVPASTAGVIRAFVPDSTHLLLDVSGYFAP